MLNSNSSSDGVQGAKVEDQNEAECLSGESLLCFADVCRRFWKEQTSLCVFVWSETVSHAGGNGMECRARSPSLSLSLSLSLTLSIKTLRTV